MKYKTFRAMAITAGVVVGAGLLGAAGLGVVRAARDTSSSRAAAKPAVLPVAAPTSSAPALPTPPGLSRSDADVLATLRRPVVDKIKDATTGKPWKVNVYSDDRVRWTRAKVDLDRDDKWDESWTIDASGTMEKKVAANDDEKYAPAVRLDRERGWIAYGAVTPPPAPAPAAIPVAAPAPATAAATSALSASDRAVLQLVKSRTPEEKIKDATKGQAFKVNLYSDDRVRWNRAKVDLDRDDKWDESWTLDASGAMQKQVAPNDDEAYTTTLELAGEAWQPR